MKALLTKTFNSISHFMTLITETPEQRDAKRWKSYLNR
jgi:hypothetical protein